MMTLPTQAKLLQRCDYIVQATGRAAGGLNNNHQLSMLSCSCVLEKLVRAEISFLTRLVLTPACPMSICLFCHMEPEVRKGSLLSWQHGVYVTL